MKSEVQQAFGHIHCGHSGRLVRQSVEHKLMFREGVDGQFEQVFEALPDISGVECSQRTDHFNVLPTQGQDISQCAQFHEKIALVGVYLREEVLQPLSHAHRSAARASASVWCGEGFVQVYVHHVETHVARSAHAEQRVEVRSVVIHQSAAGMNHLNNLENVVFEQSQGVGIGHHHCRHVVIKFVCKVVEVYRSVCHALHFDHVETAYCRRGGVGSVGRVGHNHLVAPIILPALVIGTDHHQACQFAVSAGTWLEGEVVHSRECRQRLPEHRGYLSCPTNGILRLQGVNVLKIGHRRYLVVDLGVVLHGA